MQAITPHAEQINRRIRNITDARKKRDNSREEKNNWVKFRANETDLFNRFLMFRICFDFHEFVLIFTEPEKSLKKI